MNGPSRRGRLGPIAVGFAFLLLLSAAAEARAGVGVTVSPSRFRLSRPAGETATGQILVRNDGSYPIRLRTEVADMVTVADAQGFWIRDEAPAGTTPHSCAGWIQITEGSGAVIPPEEAATVTFVVTPPPEVRSGGYGAYLFLLAEPARDLAPEAADRPQVQFVTVPRMGVSVVYEVEGAVERTGELLELDFKPPGPDRPLSIRYGFLNTGNAEVVLTGTFHILNAENLLLGKGGIGTLKTFPGEKGYAEAVWDQTLPPGRYTLLLSMELGPDAREAIVREFSFSVPEEQEGASTETR